MQGWKAGLAAGCAALAMGFSAHAALLVDPAGGTPIVFAPNADEGSASVALGFSFRFFGSSYTSVDVNTNGNLTFGGPNSDGFNTRFGVDLTLPIIAPFYDDLDTSAGAVSYKAAPGQLAVTWSGVDVLFSDPAGTATMQAVLRQDGSIVFSYDGIPATDGEATIGIGDGVDLFKTLFGLAGNADGTFSAAQLGGLSPLGYVFTPDGAGGYAVSEVPEPGTMALLALGLAALFAFARRRKATLAAAGAAACIAMPAAAQDFDLSILHSNDGESRLIDAGGTQIQYGGVARFATLARALRTESRDCSLNRGAVLISSGDNFLAGAQFNASLALPPGQRYYDSVALDLIGFTASAIGNHEFDFGPDVTARFISGFGVANPSPAFVSANLDFRFEPALLALAQQRRIQKSAVVRECGRRIGIVGATTPLLPAISSPRNVVADPNLVGTVQAEIDRLLRNGVNIIVLTSHLQSVAEDLSLVAQLRGVDVAISGGGSDLLNVPPPNTRPLVPGDSSLASITYTVPGQPPVTIAGPTYPLVVNDAAGRPVRIVTTDGNYKYVARLAARFGPTGEIVDVDLARSGPYRVSGNPADADVVAPAADVQAQVVVPVQASVAALAANVIAQTEVPLDARTSNVRSRETNLGQLMADAMLVRGAELAPSFGVPAPQVAIQNSGGIRGNALYLGSSASPPLPVASPANPRNVTELTTFDIAAFGNFVSVVPNIPRSQFKEILENAVSRFPTADGRFPQVAGFCMVFDPAGTPQVTTNNGTVTTPGARVREVKLADGTPIVTTGAVVAGDPVVMVTNDFSARGGDQYPFRGAPFTTLGKTYQQTLRDYLSSPTGLNGLVTFAAYEGMADVTTTGPDDPTGTRVATRIKRVVDPLNPPTCP
jgi:5'-nucleotidase